MIAFKPPFEIYRAPCEIGDSEGRICTAESPEIAEKILLALRAYYEPSIDKVPPPKPLLPSERKGEP